MPTTRNGLYLNAINWCPRVSVTKPTPSCRGSDWIHNFRFQNLRQRFSPNIQERIGEYVYTHIIVFKISPRLIERSIFPVINCTFFGWTIGPIVKPPNTPRPIGSLCQKMIPSNFLIVLTVKGRIPNIVG